MQTIAVFALKGGVGKSAITIFLADFLASNGDQRVLVIDLDPQQSSTVGLIGEERLLAALERRASVGQLLMDTLDRKPRANDLTNYRTWSPTSTPKGRFKYLQAVSVIASDREAWHDLDDRLRTISAAQVAAGWELLRKALAAVQDSFDVCLIDFPACYTGPITKNGIAAADWWLFPIEPNRMATRDLDSTRHLVQTVRKGINKPIHGLGTLLNRCQSRNTKEFKRSKEVLAKLAQKKTIPRLFSPASELLERTDAMEALDDTLAGGFNTIAQKYGGGPGTPLHQNLVSLTKEILQRLRIQMTAAVEVDTSRDINAEATKTYQAV